MRSDVYSVGATLFYLLTGRTPFEAKNVIALIATVLEQPAPWPEKIRPGIPKGLGRAVRRCLEKEPTERFKTYDELRQALAPYSSITPVAAPLSIRFAAGVLDVGVLGLLGLIIPLWNWERGAELLDSLSHPSWKMATLMLAGVVGSLLYYTLLEGRWGATVGKAVCRLRVVGPERNPPGFWRALARACLYVLLPAAPLWIVFAGGPKIYFESSSAMQAVIGGSSYLVIALLFCTARGRNGFAAVQDLVTKTRVVSQEALQARPVLSAGEPPPPTVEARPMVGPYHVLETIEETPAGTWLLGYDLRLLRKVWLRLVPPGTPPVEPPLRNLSRIGRLRWLAGRRSPNENWDAFEAVTGSPLLSFIHAPVQEPQPWAQVRYWLFDLASEISTARKDGTLPPTLALDRVWITGDGRAKLLDFPAPGLPSAPLQPANSAPGAPPPLPSAAGHQQTARFLGEVAAAALEGRAEAAAKAPGKVDARLPLHAREFLTRLPQVPEGESFLLAFRPLLQRSAAISRWRRAAVAAGCAAVPLLGVVTAIVGLAVAQEWSRRNPGLFELNTLLQQRWATRTFAKKQAAPTDRQMAVYIAVHYRSLITNQTAWSNMLALTLIKGDARRFAEESVAAHPAPTEQEIAEADAAVAHLISKGQVFEPLKQPGLRFTIFNLSLAFYVGLPAALAALLFRRGLVLFIARVTFVRRDGTLASRLRVFWRALVAWSPVWLGSILSPILMDKQPLSGELLVSALIAGLAVLSVALPERGLPDRLAGTWPVPR